MLFQEFSKVCHLPSPAFGCDWLYKNSQPIGVTVYTRIALRALKVSYSDVGEGAFAVN